MSELCVRVLSACAPPAIPLGVPGRDERQAERKEFFEAATAERAELFATLRCPESIRKPRSRA